VISNLTLLTDSTVSPKRGICRMRFGTKSRLIVGGEEFVAETALRIPGGFGGKMAKSIVIR